MFKAIWRYFRAIGYLITGRIDDARMTLSANPAVIQATFDNVIAEKRKRIQQYKDAIGGMIAQEEKKRAELKRQTGEVERLSKLKDGAAAMARKVVERHNGDIEAVKQDAEYLKCQAAFKDFSSTLEEKEARCKELEEDIETIAKSVAGHKIQLEAVLREYEKIKQEKHETVADMITAKEEKELSDMITGISEDRTSQELEEMRELRNKAKATARVSRELAGTDAKRAEEEFLVYAEKSSANTEFDALIGLSQKPEAEKAGPEGETKIPEA